MTDELIAIAAAGHHWRGRKNREGAALCREPFIVREAGSGTRLVVEHALAIAA
jgi:hypothetical protein